MTAGSVSAPQIIPLRIPPPGKAQREIDTNTLIEIKSDTPGACIYYTLDGSKPELIRKPGYGPYNTLEYKGPIILPEGKIVLKALAVTKDYRESSIVTKVFVVEYQQPNILFPVEDDDKNFLKDMATQNKEGGTFATKPKKNRLNVEIKPAWDETSQDLQDRRPSHRSPQGPQLLASGLGATEHREESTSAQPTESLQFASSSAVTSQKSLASTQVSRIQSETDFLKCAHCSAPRLSEPLAHFCQKCGSPVPPVPVRRFPAPEGAQMAPCLECRHLVPMNTPTCIICEAPIAPQLQPQNNICIKGKVICQVCGTGNPLHHKHCATCESKLPEVQMPVFGGGSCPALQGQQRAQCSKCHGVNQSDARFCAWCGAKPGPPPSYFSCSKCGTSNQPYARFCVLCGVYIEPPCRQSSPGSPTAPGDSLGASQAKLLQAQVAWQTCPVSLPKSRAGLTEREDRGTQTIGLFYPSSKLLEKKELELISQKEKVEKMSDHKPLLTAISPGKGYWRKQLDHVCAHVRSYAQNNLEFRTLIGEPQMGKINYATISEDDYEVTITLNFAAVNKDIHPNRAVKFSNDYLSAGTEVTDGQDGSQTNFGRDDHLFYSRGKIKRTKSRTLTGQEYKPSPESRQLLDELGPTGKGRITFIEQLLSDGADPNSLSEEERPALTVAVLNKHAGAISPLVQKGADIDQQSGPHNNTALHEAVLLGLEGEECIRALLRCNASVQKRNAAGHSALDLAVAAGDNKVISLFQVSLDREH
ncbi:double zinc ribbon and ankyrin repeat-containing protein 1 isoform X1 [Vidua macroura]|uniref:double zinc ribbon and ankyrin repeat-containing protein 1 isoform X1 n=1 Tax=Vidua macroura TaxID=187451 RepID=UPI0023A80F9D|nr:double zinc ribbon and ankyrin repeat-containing protein 1 isoform X1 [Vidua macroura]XP_053829558.1 double zinc ribbon and ankyrin repeat-containing protein 1 isoform X1 [Vidua macroura]XP_053829559.1 double zinc ribbon and ankyrin repeat-containing protein 1 isoform X1 [Vidua macroura]XP_053829560.1 double zinc ribbon and ankyrin repeat-containing protein 1 isoform X1 [Vidua macroura]XP_053829561.1 double zinc ribbon and ankyrin repeat-containing protein 1 isoform X1 [Vidua macroura]